MDSSPTLHDVMEAAEQNVSRCYDCLVSRFAGLLGRQLVRNVKLLSYGTQGLPGGYLGPHLPTYC